MQPATKLSGLLLAITTFFALPALTLAQVDSTWTGGGDGVSWNDSANWSAGVPDGPGFFNAIIDGDNLTTSAVVTGISSFFEVDSLAVDAGDSLTIGNNSDLSIITDVGRPDSGMVVNDGLIEVANSGSITDLVIRDNVALSGSGTVRLGGSTLNSRIADNIGSNGHLTNTSTIEGFGQIGANTLQITNLSGGLIDANSATSLALTLDPNAMGIVNQGTLRGSGGGVLLLTGNADGAFDNTGGLIEATDTGSEVQLSNFAVVTGGTVRGTSDGLVRLNVSQNAFFGDVTFEGNIQSDNNTDFGISGNITNNATITMVSNGSLTDLEVQAGGATLNGNGRVILTTTSTNNAGINGISNAVLTNSATHTIEGQGSIGRNTIGVVNQGLIDANISGQVLQIDPDDEAGDGSGLTNTATMRASGGGILQLTGNAGGTFTNSGGVIEAIGSGSEVQLTTFAVVTGGTIRGTSDGLVRVNASQNAFFSDVTFEGNIQSDNNTDFGIGGTISNSGTISIISNGSDTDLEVQAGGATLNGNGKVVLATTAANRAGVNGVSNAVLTNSATHTIEGQGNIGENTIGIVNHGLIDANVGGQVLQIDPDDEAVAGSGLTNTATMRASGGGILQLTGNAGGTFANSGGVIEATGTGSEVQLTDFAVVSGGTIRGISDGLVRVNISQNAFFGDVTFEGTIRSDNNSDFGIGGTITNNGTISIVSSGSDTDLEVQAGGATLTGNGKVVLATAAANRAGINGISNAVLTNTATHTIEGQGSIGRNTIGIVNQGLIDANVSGQTLTLDPDAVNDFDNAGTAQASGGGVLILEGNGGGQFVGSGLYQALAGSEIQVLNFASVTNATLRGTDGGVVRVPVSQNVFFTDVTFEGDIRSDNNTDFGVSGTIANNGTITINSTGSQTDVEFQASGGLMTGNGQLVLAGTNAGINSVGGGVIGNGAGHTITGDGNIGRNMTDIDNQVGGIILADDPAKNLVVSPGTNLTNAGTLRASDGATLLVNNFADGGVNNSGLIQAIGANSRVNLLADNNFTSQQHMDNDGGVIEATDGGRVDLNTNIGRGTYRATNGGVIEQSSFHVLNLGLTPVPNLSGPFFDIQEGHFFVDDTSRIKLYGQAVRVNDPGPPNSSTEAIFGLRALGPNATITGGGAGMLTYNARLNTAADPFINLFALPLIQGTMTLFNGKTVFAFETTIEGNLILKDAGTEYNAAGFSQPGFFRQTSGVVSVGAGALLRAFDAGDTLPDMQFSGGMLTGSGDVVALETGTGTDGISDNKQILFSGGTIAPGDSVGTISLEGDVFMVNNSRYSWEIDALTGTPGTDWDLLEITGPLDFDDNSLIGTFDSGVVIEIDTQDIPLAGFDSLQNYSWTIATATSILNFDADDFRVDASELAENNPVGGEFSVSQIGNELILNYTGGAPPLLTADFDEDGDVDPADLVQWTGDYGLNNDSDADYSGISDGADFLAWQQQFGSGTSSVGAVPEPATLALVLAFVVSATFASNRPR